MTQREEDRVQAALDRLEIRELIDAYSDAINRVDGPAWSACWAEDARWNMREKSFSGREAIVAAWTRAMDSFESVFFSAFPGQITLRGDEADVLIHTLEYLKPKVAPAKLQSGIYRDKVKRVDGHWVFIEKNFTSKELPL